jgi:hypothetical protein
MLKIFSSASKIVFILMAAALVAFTAMGIISGEMFFAALSMVFGYYFKSASTTSVQ